MKKISEMSKEELKKEVLELIKRKPRTHRSFVEHWGLCLEVTPVLKELIEEGKIKGVEKYMQGWRTFYMSKDLFERKQQEVVKWNDKSIQIINAGKAALMISLVYGIDSTSKKAELEQLFLIQGKFSFTQVCEKLIRGKDITEEILPLLKKLEKNKIINIYKDTLAGIQKDIQQETIPDQGC
ncbi:MAG: hypothetical protein WC942_09770 [Clostridia bacterium]|jgi:hypothetical protein